MIEVVKNNPFRILGLPAIASDKEIAKRIAELEVYIKMEKDIKYDIDFPFLGNFQRTSESIQVASNKLNKSDQRVFYSLFWFDNIEEFEFEKLKEENINESITIIKNSYDNGEVESVAQFTGYKNLSILYLYKMYNDDQNEEEYFYKYFYAFSKFLTSNQLRNYITKISKNKNNINDNVVVVRYLDVVDKILKDYLLINLDSDRDFIEKYIDYLYFFPKEIKDNVKNKYIKEALQFIRNEVDKCTQKRKKEPEDSYKSGTNLYFNTNEYLLFLRHNYNYGDIRYQTIADKVAEEILQCSVDYFNKCYDSDVGIYPGEESLELSEYADSIAVGERLKEKIAKDLKTTKEWINGNDEREKEKQIDYHINFIHKQIESLPTIEDYNIDEQQTLFEEQTDNAIKYTQLTLFDEIKEYPKILDKYLYHCKGHLAELKILLNISKRRSLSTILQHSKYMNLSNSVVDNAMNMIIHFADNMPDKTNIIYLLDEIAKFDMNGDTKILFEKNMDAILNDYRIYLESMKQLDIELKRIKERKGRKKKIRNFIIFTIILSVFMVIIFISGIPDQQVSVLHSNNDQTSNETPSSKKDYKYNKEREILPDVIKLPDVIELPKMNLITPKKFEPIERIKISIYRGNQLVNGSSPYDKYFGYGIYDKNYFNEITFKNGYNTDAIVCLVHYYTDKTIRNEYIRKNSNFTMTNIPNGTYYIKVFSGNDWDPEKILANGKVIGGFETDIVYSISDENKDLIKLEQTEDHTGMQYTIYTITLYQVIDGNMKSDMISEKEFFK